MGSSREKNYKKHKRVASHIDKLYGDIEDTEELKIQHSRELKEQAVNYNSRIEKLDDSISTLEDENKRLKAKCGNDVLLNGILGIIVGMFIMFVIIKFR